MLKGTIFKICFAILIITFCSYLSISVMAQDCNEDITGITTVPGNFIVPDQWICEWYPSNPLEFDDGSTPNTISPGGTINVYVLGGSPPFSWSNPGNGYTWLDGNETTNRQNRLHCNTGTCGVNYDLSAEFTVTEHCGGVTQGIVIRVTGGVWKQKTGYDQVGCYWDATYCGCNGHCNCADAYAYTLTIGLKRWKFFEANLCITDYSYSEWRDKHCGGGTPLYLPPPPYNTPTALTGSCVCLEDGFWKVGICKMAHFHYWQYECP
jgi:hypothetical protein